MRRLPAEHQHVQVAFDGRELLAHRLGPHVDGPRKPLQAYAKCGAAQGLPLPLMSVQRADQMEAEPCEHDACFGPVLAAPPAEWRTLRARLPEPPKRRTRAGARA